MEKQYPIFSKGKIVGEASLTRKGMFWHIKLTCRAEEAEPRKIVVTSVDHMLELGIYAWTTEKYESERWVSAKELPTEEITFSLEQLKQEKFIPITEALPCPALEKLAEARFQTVAGQPGILFSD